MALLNYQKKEINAKIVYYGPGLSGKTTNIQYIYKKLKPEHKGKLMTLATQTDRTLFFDFLPVELGEIKGLKTRFQIYTVPGQVYYNATRKLVLKNVDGIVFVADSQKKMMNDNIESLKNLEDNLRFYNRSLKDVPIVFQYNKRDLPDVLSVDELQQALNKYKFPYFESVAHTGQGVLQTLTTVSKLVLQKLRTSTDFTRAEAETVSPEEPRQVKEEPQPAPEVASEAEVEVEPVPSAIEGKVIPSVPVTREVELTDSSVQNQDSAVEVGAPERVSLKVFKIPLKLTLEDGKVKKLNITITFED
jgi:small GTP-binding protein